MARTADRIISVGGGKGGVGKSVMAANLAVAMAQEGHRVVLVDADLGAANLHTMFGLSGQGHSIQSFIQREVDSLEQARVATQMPGLSLVRGTGAVVGAANINHQQKQRLLRHVAGLDAEVIVVDVGAGSAYNQLDLFDLADLRVVVMTPQLTSIQNAYAFVKGAVYRALSAVLKLHGRDDLLSQVGPDVETTTLASLINKAGLPPAALGEIAAFLKAFGARLLGNQVFNSNEARMFTAMGRMLRDFLGINAPVLGFARASRAVHDSINRRQPFMLDAAGEESANAIRAAARQLLDEDVLAMRAQRDRAIDSRSPPALAPVSAFERVAA